MVLASCAKVEVKENVSAASPIVFNSPVVGVMTKTPTYSAFPDDQSFDVWALFSASAINGLNSDAETYFEGLAFEKNGTSWKNAGAVWPKQAGYLTFHAFYPHGVATHSFTSSSTGFHVSSYEVDNSAADLMYSDYALNKQSSDQNANHSNPAISTGYTGIDILFHHALAKVRFQVQLNEVITSTTYAVTKVEIKNQYRRGNFSAWTTYDDDSWGTASPTWAIETVTSTNEVTSYAQVSSALNPVVNNTTAQVLSGELFVMPQLLDHSVTNYGEGASTNKVTAKITFTEKIGDLDAQTIEKEFTLEALTSQWQPGKIYTYTILIKHDPILLDPGVEDWDTLAAVDYDHA